MPTIGFDTTVGFAPSARTTADPHFLINLAGTHTPGSAETITEVGFHGDAGGLGTFEIGVYRTDTLALIVSAQVTSTGTNRFVTSVSAAISAGVTYAIAWRCVSDAYAQINAIGSDQGTRNTGLTGANALAATFTDTGPAITSQFAFFATTTAAAATPKRMLLMGVG